MSILDSLSSAEEWEKFLGYKKEKRQLSKKEEAQLESFIAEERYLPICAGFDFGYPEKKEITKLGSPKKRVVYSYGEDETWVLKFLAYLLYRYDGCLSDSCYSFRRNRTAKTAFDRILAVRDLGSMYSLKLDIHDYFNSIDTGQLIKTLEEIITDDEPLLSLLKDLLLLDRCIWQGEVIEEKRGAMAGVPLASFFANVYLKDLDLLFEERGVPYFRYSDDMIIFSETKEELGESFSLIEDFLREKGLTLNMSKYRMAGPGEAWDFLGFCYRNGQIDLADATVKKMMGKIRRKAGKLYRRRKEKGVSFEKAARSMINSFDHKFYDLTGTNDFTWTRFYFPVITTAEGLKKIDRYMVQYLRYLYSGRHYKGNYRVSYEDLKKLGYTPLAAEYYNWKRENRELDELNR